MSTSDADAAPPAEGDAAARLLALIGALAAELHRRPPAGRVHLDADLDRDLGMDSLARVELLSRAERHFGVTLPEHAFAEARTPRELLKTLVRAAGTGRDTTNAAMVEPPPRAGAAAAPADTSTLVEVLEWHANRHPERVHIRFYEDEGAGAAITYRGLLDGAHRMAAALQALGVTRGSPVVLMLQTGEDYFFCFFGVLLAGGIPVPIYPPARASQLEDHVRRQQGILENCEAAVLITMPEAQAVARLLRSQVDSLRHVMTPAELAGIDAELTRPAVHASDLAFLQYTSGSTGQPKGVTLTHANLLANIRAMSRQIRAGPEDVFVSWLPLYHDMGLIGAWLGSLYCAAELVIMSPLAFIARPQRWLRAIHRHRATLSASPNFGYELCLRRIVDEELHGIDLGNWRCAFNGAEPVSPDTMSAFAKRFGPHGLRPEALMPVYGLAECSVGLAFPPLGRGPLVDRVRREPFLRDGCALPAGTDEASALSFVSSGRPLPGHEIRVVGAGQHELPERQVGTLQFRGPSATSGYYRNREATRDLLRGGWLDSGDLAYAVGGEIFITGRSKDLIIYAGRNLYPHELEEAVGKIAGVRAGRVAAFGARDERLGTERLVVVAEKHEREEAERDRLRAEIGGVVAGLSAGPPDDVVLAPPGTILKTPSGKVRRTASRERYERGEIARPPAPVWRQILRLVVEDIPRRLRRLRRRFASSAYGAWAHVVFWLIAPVGWLTVVALPTLEARWRASRSIVGLLARLTGIRIRVQGREHLPRGETCVYIANHSSYVDSALLLLALESPVGFVAKAELRGNVFARVFLRRIGTEFVERFDPRRGAEDVQGLSARLREGKSLLFFPEGTFTRAPGLRPFRLGAFIAAAEAGAPIVPIALNGSRSLLRPDSWRPNPGEVTLTICPPLGVKPDARGRKDVWAAAVDLRTAGRAALLGHVGEPDLDDAGGT